MTYFKGSGRLFFKVVVKDARLKIFISWILSLLRLILALNRIQR